MFLWCSYEESLGEKHAQNIETFADGRLKGHACAMEVNSGLPESVVLIG